MVTKKKIVAIIVAAGAGTRMNSGIPKQCMIVDGKPMLLKTAEVFQTSGCIDEIIIVTSSVLLEEMREMLQKEGIRAALTCGGKQRQDSVYAGLKILPQDTDYVIIHDAARPYVTHELIREVIQAAFEESAAVCAVPVKDTIRMKNFKQADSVTLDRTALYAVQTPQAFEKELILSAYEKAYEDGFYGTDDAVLVEKIGKPVAIIPGAYENIKITTKEDLQVGFEQFSVRVGTGFDVHMFCENRKLILGGVEIPFERGLAGHSDADVLVHAVMDALLGAAGCGDIGMHFPDKEKQYKDISSLILLSNVSDLITQKGFAVGNIDATVIAQKPKIAFYRKEMIAAVANALKISEDRVTIKGTTTEGLGFTGREEGIAAQAVCTIYAERKI